MKVIEEVVALFVDIQFKELGGTSFVVALLSINLIFSKFDWK